MNREIDLIRKIERQYAHDFWISPLASESSPLAQKL